MQFRADIFNLFNHPNFTNPDGGICSSVTEPTLVPPPICAPNANFGRVGQTIADANGTQIGGGTARQTQFSLRFSF
jgi:hypothetical protein